MLTPILNNLYRHTSAVAGSQHPVNSYAWLRDDGWVLIDPAEDMSSSDLKDISPLPVRAVFATHVQAEHISGVENFPGAQLWVPRGDAYLCAGNAAYRRSLTQWAEPWLWDDRGYAEDSLAGAPTERPPVNPLVVAGFLDHGSRQFGLYAVGTPGQGKHAVTLLADIGDVKVGFCGDLVCEGGKLWNWFDADWDYGTSRGHRQLLDSANRLLSAHPDMLLPAHGDPIGRPDDDLGALGDRLASILDDRDYARPGPINFPDIDSPMPGFRELLPNLHQWRNGNLAILVSETGGGLVVDDGLCYWEPPLEKRERHHREVIAAAKSALGIDRIEIVIPTHYHLDHVENIPALAKAEAAEVVCLDVVADVLEHPEKYAHLASRLDWLGARNASVGVDRRITGGERIRWHEYDLELFHLGGQTYYHLGVDVTIGGVRTLFVGDAIHNEYPIPGGVLCFNDADPETRGWLYGFERMRERRPDLLVCGHGSAIVDPADLLDQGVEVWRRRIERYRTLAARPDLRLFFDPFV